MPVLEREGMAGESVQDLYVSTVYILVGIFT